MDFIPYKVNEALENVFIQIPVELFNNELYSNLNSDSILLYGLLLARLSLSIKNKWEDKDGNIILFIQDSENVRCNYKDNNKNDYSNVTHSSKKKNANFEQRVYAPGELDKLYCNFENE